MTTVPLSPAQYRPAELDEYRGNPLICALPPIQSGSKCLPKRRLWRAVNSRRQKRSQRDSEKDATASFAIPLSTA